MRLYFLRSDVALGTLNSPISISDANNEQITCAVEIDDYEDLVGSQLGLGESVLGTAHQGLGDNIMLEFDANGYTYVAAKTEGTPTHTASGLVIDLFVEMTT
jgi:hypothetical protein